MRMRVLGAALAATVLLAAVPAPQTPEQVWRAGIVDANEAWAKRPHAILKIQDAAYLGEAQSATLVGIKGKPASYKWIAGDGKGLLTVVFHTGHVKAFLNGKEIDGARIEKGIPIDAGIDVQGFPTQVAAGTMGMRVMLYNQTRADALAFKGVDYFPYDPAYRVTASFKPDPKLPPRVFRTSRGTDKQFFHAGDATFTLNGKRFTLPFYAGDKDPAKIKDMSSFFMDDLTGTVAYGAGRYVDIDGFGAFPPKTAVIDFNDAYNPNCARSAFFTCPVAVDSIGTAVKAGEKDPHTRH